jgi:hypothetical protein
MRSSRTTTAVTARSRLSLDQVPVPAHVAASLYQHVGAPAVRPRRRRAPIQRPRSCLNGAWNGSVARPRDHQLHAPTELTARARPPAATATTVSAGTCHTCARDPPYFPAVGPTGRRGEHCRKAGTRLGRAVQTADRQDPVARPGTRAARAQAGARAAGDLRLSDPERGQDPRRDRRRPTVQIPPRLRPPQRHRAPTRLVREQRTTPTQPHRQSTDQRSDPPHRDHPSALGTSPRMLDTGCVITRLPGC